MEIPHRESMTVVEVLVVSTPQWLNAYDCHGLEKGAG